MTDSDTASQVSVTGFQKDAKDGTTTPATLVQPSSPGNGPRPPPGKLDRKESYKAQRKNYAKEKKRVERELLSTFKDESIIVLADWLKIRGSLKKWTKLWCVLKPGLLLLYKSQKTKSSHWIGTIILSTCELIERPSKKDGFCFKLFHPMDQSIWASRGPEGETMGAVVQPLPTSHLIFRSPNNAAGKCWMDALELALRCSSLLLRTMSSQTAKNADGNGMSSAAGTSAADKCDSNYNDLRDSFNESDVERHFKSDLDDGGSVDEGVQAEDDDLEEEEEEEEEDEDDYDEYDDRYSDLGDRADAGGLRLLSNESPLRMTNYERDPRREVFGDAVDQTEEISDENKSIVWFLVKQVRPGMDLSKVVLPTFILEPRSFLEKLSDYYYHVDILSEAVRDDSPFSRIKTVVRWYLSGFYKRPKGLKKPYNPILGERFRCYWQHENGSKTYYIAEQVSHHPPISAFYVTNRQEGFTFSASILAKSKFYGNSTSAILDGVATLSLLPRGEEYKLTMPYAHCKGILMGTMTIELGGKVYIECGKTGYSAELEFKLRPFLGGGEFTNAVSGKIKLGKEVIATLNGHWDDAVTIRDEKTRVDEALWAVTESVRSNRLPRYTVPMDEQDDFESAKMWRKVSAAIDGDDQVAATEEKSFLEEAQRSHAKELKAREAAWQPKYFEIDQSSGQYVYTRSDIRPWDSLNDVYTYESDFAICTKTKHKTPMVRAMSIVSVSEEVQGQLASNSTPNKAGDAPEVRKTRSSRRRGGQAAARGKLLAKTASAISGSSQEESSNKDGPGFKQRLSRKEPASNGHHVVDGAEAQVISSQLEDAVRPLQEQNKIMDERLCRLQLTLDEMASSQRQRDSNSNLNRDMVLLVILVVMIQAVLNWVLSTRAHQHIIDHQPAPGRN